MGEMALAVRSIEDAGTVVANARKATEVAMESYRRDTQNHVQLPAPDKLFGMLEMVAFMPEKGPLAAAMVGAQAGKFLNAAFNEVETAGAATRRSMSFTGNGRPRRDFQSLDDEIRIARDDSLKPSDERKLLTKQKS